MRLGAPGEDGTSGTSAADGGPGEKGEKGRHGFFADEGDVGSRGEAGLDGDKGLQGPVCDMPSIVLCFVDVLYTSCVYVLCFSKCDGHFLQSPSPSCTRMFLVIGTWNITIRVFGLTAGTCALLLTATCACQCMTQRGAAGNNGVKGMGGETGDVGAPGTPGVDGEDGVDGADGPQGPSGDQGASGKKVRMSTGRRTVHFIVAFSAIAVTLFSCLSDAQVLYAVVSLLSFLSVSERLCGNWLCVVLSVPLSM